MAKKKSSKTTKRVSHHTHTEPSSSDDVFVWKVGFFVLLGILILMVGYTMLGAQQDSMLGEVGTDTPKGGAGSDGTGTAATGKVIIEEYSDFECPFCSRALPTVEQIYETYGDDVEVIYKHFPLSFHPNAQKAAEASECARDQGKFQEYHDVLFANQRALTGTDLKQYAVDLGLDSGTFDSCLDNGDKASVVQEDFEEGKSKGVTGTPTFFVNGQKLVGAQPFSAFKPLIDAQLAGEAPAAPAEAAPPPAPEVPTPGEDDADFDIIVIEDPSCTNCDTTAIEQALTETLFNTATITRHTIDSEQGTEFIEMYDLPAVPAFLLSKDIQDTANYARISSTLEDKGEYYLIASSAVGNVKYLKTPELDESDIRTTNGDPNAPVTIIEFSDFQCPFCDKFRTDAYVQIVSEYVETGKVKVVFKHLPLSFHSYAQKAAEASECAADQGMFWEYHDKLFENQNALAVGQLKQYAADLGLDTATFDTCLDNGDHAAKVEADTALARSFGITGTPGFFVGSQKISGAQPFANFQAAIEAELANS